MSDSPKTTVVIEAPLPTLDTNPPSNGVGASNEAPAEKIGSYADAGVKIGATPQPEKTEFQKLIPDEFKDAPWVQNLLKNDTPTKELFRQMAEAQKLIGARPQGVVRPPENATPEQVQQYHRELGVPDDLSKYVIHPTQWSEDEKRVGEIITRSRDDMTLKQIATEAQKLGVTPSQLQGLTSTYEKTQAAKLKQSIASQKEQALTADKEFVTSMQAKFGANWETVAQNGRKLIEQLVPEDVRTAFPSYDNRQALALAVALHSIHSSLVKPDTFSGTKDNAAITMPAKTLESERARSIELMSQKAFRDPLDPKHKQVVAQVNEIRKGYSQFFDKK